MKCSRRIFSGICLLFLAWILFVTSLNIDANASPQGSGEKELQQIIQHFLDAVSLSNEDVRDELESVFEEDVVVILSNGQIWNGKEAVLAGYNESLNVIKSTFSDLTLAFEQQSADILTDHAEVIGIFHLEGTLKEDNSTFKRDVLTTFTFKKTAGTWLISRDQSTLLKQEKTTPAGTAQTATAVESSVQTLEHADAPAAIRVNGKPFFLICARSAVVSEFAEYKRAGFNTVYTHQPANPGLDEAQEEDLYAIHTFPDYLYSKQDKRFPPAYWQQLKDQISQWKDHPALLAWVEPTDTSVWKYNPLEIREVYNLTANGDNTRVRVLNFGAPGPLLNDYLEYADVLVYESWPDKNTSVVPRKMDNFVKAAQGRPVWYLQQIIEGHNLTTAEEFRSKIFLAVNHSASGVMIEGFREHLWPEWGTGDKYVSMGSAKLVEMRKESMRIAHELKLLAPAILAGPLTNRMYIGDPVVDLKAYLEPGTDLLYLVAVNGSDKNKKQSFTVPEPKLKAAAVIGENRRIPIQANTFTDSFKPYETHLYRLKVPVD